MSKLPDSIDVGDFSMDNMTGTVHSSVCSSRVPLPRLPTLECCDFESERIIPLNGFTMCLIFVWSYFQLNKQSQSMCRATAFYNQLIYWLQVRICIFFFFFFFLPADPDTFLAGLSVRRSCAKPLGNQTPETIIASLQPVADTPPWLQAADWTLLWDWGRRGRWTTHLNMRLNMSAGHFWEAK